MICIFLVEPNDKSKYKSLLVFSDNDEEARVFAHASINSAQVIVSGSDTPQSDQVYLDDTLSTCNQVQVEVLEFSHDSARVRYLGKDYFLVKGHPVSTDPTD